MAYWTFLFTEHKYNVWQSPDGYYQVTKTKAPPVSTAGYKDLNAIWKLKGVAP